MTASGRILVVDDEADIRELLARLLERKGYSVVSASNGAEALQELRSSSAPCVILLDLMMPVMDGFQFRAEQQSDPAIASVPIVVITAGDLTRAKDLDAAAILPKPLDLPKLMAAVQECCGSSTSAAG